MLRNTQFKKTDSKEVKSKQIILYPSTLFNEEFEDEYNQGMLAIASRTYMRGLVMGTCDKFGHPIVILQKNQKNNTKCDSCQFDENSDFCCSGKFSRLESNLFYDHWANLCKKIRDSEGKNNCCHQDEIIAEYLLNNIETLKNGEVKINSGEKNIKAYVRRKNKHVCLYYECPTSHYNEIAVNINVNGIQGVMIIGQLFFRDTKQEQKDRFQAALDLFYKDEEEKKQVPNDVYDSKKTANETIEDIFKCVSNLETSLLKEYNFKTDVNVKSIQEKMIETFEIYYKKKCYEIDTNESQVEICECKYNVLKKAFKKSLEELIKITNNQIEIYYSIPSGLYFNSKNDVKRVCGILTDSEKTIFNRFEPSVLNEFEKVSDEFVAYSKKLDLLEKKHVSLMIKSKNIDVHIADIFERFLQLSCIYITELFAQFNGAQIAEFTTIMRHELGQLNEAILIRINSYQEAINKQEEDDYTYGFIDECNHMIEDFKAHAHSTMLRCNSSRYFSRLPNLHKEWFYPYESFLYKWKYIYSKAAKNKHLKFVMTPVQLSDLSRPLMYADKSMIEQVAYNLTNNALKYSIPGTKINVDCRLSENKEDYLLIITNYGRAIKEEEKDMLFKYGYRGSNNNDANGSGLGLYLSKEIAEQHGGTLKVETEKVSDFDVSCLYLYNDMPDAFVDEKTKISLDEELYRLKQTEYIADIKRPVLSNNSFTPYLIKRYLNKGTWKYKFILSIPYYKRIGG